MEDKLYAKIKTIGTVSKNLVNNNYFVLFENENDEFSNFGYTVENPIINGEIKVNDIVQIDDHFYKIKKIPEGFNDYIKNQFQFELIIDRNFDCVNQILLDGTSFPEIKEGTIIKIKES